MFDLFVMTLRIEEEFLKPLDMLFSEGGNVFFAPILGVDHLAVVEVVGFVSFCWTSSRLSPISMATQLIV
ncbi:hypothetical protein [Ochrobactrum quorumnocens]|uniref:hypothetical protein n=1 Tax=Ochrobactrum quorumnocens TaxID=271865 RepID=UPI001780E48E|nr:hypothetical protein [[Ochrobactrum] quorumnocens]